MIANLQTKKFILRVHFDSASPIIGSANALPDYNNNNYYYEEPEQNSSLFHTKSFFVLQPPWSSGGSLSKVEF